jgi:uncharacterized membrane protein
LNWKARVPVFAAALWWGSLTAIGFIAVPLLFAQLPNATAGQMAARLFTAQTWLSIVCGMLVLMAARRPNAFVVAGLLLALLGEFAVAPRIVARQDLALWHAVGTGFYGLQWLCAVVVLWRVSARSS